MLGLDFFCKVQLLYFSCKHFIANRANKTLQNQLILKHYSVFIHNVIIIRIINFTVRSFIISRPFHESFFLNVKFGVLNFLKILKFVYFSHFIYPFIIR